MSADKAMIYEILVAVFPSEMRFLFSYSVAVREQTVNAAAQQSAVGAQACGKGMSDAAGVGSTRGLHRRVPFCTMSLELLILWKESASKLSKLGSFLLSRTMGRASASELWLRTRPRANRHC